MSNVKKVLIAIIGSGLSAGCVYCASLFPSWVGVFTPASAVFSGIMVKLIGWPPKDGS